MTNEGHVLDKVVLMNTADIVQHLQRQQQMSDSLSPGIDCNRSRSSGSKNSLSQSQYKKSRLIHDSKRMLPRSKGSKVTVEESGTHVVRIKVLGLVGVHVKNTLPQHLQQQKNDNNERPTREQLPKANTTRPSTSLMPSDTKAIVSIIRNDVVYGTSKSSDALQGSAMFQKTVPASRNSSHHSMSSLVNHHLLAKSGPQSYVAIWDASNEGSNDVLSFETQLQFGEFAIISNEHCDLVVGLQHKHTGSPQRLLNVFPIGIARLAIPNDMVTSGKRIVDLPLNKSTPSRFTTDPFQEVNRQNQQSQNSRRQQRDSHVGSTPTSIAPNEILDIGIDVEVSFPEESSATEQSNSIINLPSKEDEKKEDVDDFQGNSFTIGANGESVLRIEVEVIEKESNVEVGYCFENDESVVSEQSHPWHPKGVSDKVDGSAISYNDDYGFVVASDHQAPKPIIDFSSDNKYTDEMAELASRLMAVDPSIERVLSNDENSYVHAYKERQKLESPPKQGVSGEDETETTTNDIEEEDEEAAQINRSDEVTEPSKIMEDLPSNTVSSPISRKRSGTGSKAVQRFAKNLFVLPKELKRITSSKRQPIDPVVAETFEEESNVEEKKSIPSDYHVSSQPSNRINFRILKKRGLKSKTTTPKSQTPVDLPKEFLRNDIVDISADGFKQSRRIVVNDLKLLDTDPSPASVGMDPVSSIAANGSLISSPAPISEKRVPSRISTETSVATTPINNRKNRFHANISADDSISNPSTSDKSGPVSMKESVDTKSETISSSRSSQKDRKGNVAKVTNRKVAESTPNVQSKIKQVSPTRASDKLAQLRSPPVHLLRSKSPHSFTIESTTHSAKTKKTGSEPSGMPKVVSTAMSSQRMESFQSRSEENEIVSKLMQRSQTAASEDRAMEVAIKQASKTVQDIGKFDIEDGTEKKIPRDLVVNKSKVKSDYKIARVQNKKPKDMVKSRSRNFADDSLELISMDGRLGAPVFCGMKSNSTQMKTSLFGFDLTGCGAFPLFGDDDYSSGDETWTQFDTIRSLQSNLRDDPSWGVGPDNLMGFCRPNSKDDMSIKSRERRSPLWSTKNITASDFVRCASKRGWNPEIESITRSFDNDTLDTFERFESNHRDRTASETDYDESQLFGENNEESHFMNDEDKDQGDGQSTSSRSFAESGDDSATSVVSSEGGDDMVKPEEVEFSLEEGSEEELITRKAFRRKGASKSENSIPKSSSDRLSSEMNRVSSEYDESYSKLLSTEESVNPVSTPRKGHRAENESSDSRGKDDGSPKSVLDAHVDVPTSKSFAQSFMDLVASKRSTDTEKVKANYRVSSRPRVPKTLETLEDESVGELTATTHEMQVEIDEFKRQIESMERKLGERSIDSKEDPDNYFEDYKKLKNKAASEAPLSHR